LITNELIKAQGSEVNIGGYYCINDDLTTKAMRPSNTFNNIISKC
ncbi:MAG: hypothetical protein GQ552_03155, partial [Flavobacteriaceae bacterium]|nr:hypothetical protein [Flavobacteriaceae bacterium]